MKIPEINHLLFVYHRVVFYIGTWTPISHFLKGRARSYLLRRNLYAINNLVVVTQFLRVSGNWLLVWVWFNMCTPLSSQLSRKFRYRQLSSCYRPVIVIVVFGLIMVSNYYFQFASISFKVRTLYHHHNHDCANLCFPHDFRPLHYNLSYCLHCCNVTPVLYKCLWLRYKNNFFSTTF